MKLLSSSLRNPLHSPTSRMTRCTRLTMTTTSAISSRLCAFSTLSPLLPPPDLADVRQIDRVRTALKMFYKGGRRRRRRRRRRGKKKKKFKTLIFPHNEGVQNAHPGPRPYV